MTACTKIELRYGKAAAKKHIRYNWWLAAFLCKRRKISYIHYNAKKEDLHGLPFSKKYSVAFSKTAAHLFTFDILFVWSKWQR
jgi:hypothetical protein